MKRWNVHSGGVFDSSGGGQVSGRLIHEWWCDGLRGGSTNGSLVLNNESTASIGRVETWVESNVSIYWSVYIPPLTYSSWTQVAEMSFFHGVSSRRGKLQLGSKPQLLRIERGQLRGSVGRGFLGMSNWKTTPGQTQKSLGGLYILSGLRKPWDSPGDVGVWCRQRSVSLLDLLLLWPDHEEAVQDGKMINQKHLKYSELISEMVKLLYI